MKKARLSTAIIFVLRIFCTLPALAQSESIDTGLAEPNVYDGKVVDANVAKIVASKKEIRTCPNYVLTANHKHLKEINDRLISLGNGKRHEERLEKIHDYLSGLDTEELLGIALELADVNDLESSGLVLVPHLKKTMSKGFSSSKICNMIKDKKHNSKFRAFLIDIATKLPKQYLVKTNNITSSDSNNDNPNLSIVKSDTGNSEINETLISLVEDKSNKAELRRYALLQMGKENSNLTAITNEKEMVAEFETSENRLLKIFRNDKSSPVRGAAITALRRLKSSNLESVLNETLSAPEDFDDIIIRHAVVSAAKSNLRDEYVGQIKKIAFAKRGCEVYGSAIYALGIIGNIDAICAIADVYHQYGFQRTIRSAFRKNEKTILSMLTFDKDSYVISCGILAVRIGRIAAAKELIESVATTHENPLLRKEAQKVLDEIGHYETIEFQHKWEDDNVK